MDLTIIFLVIIDLICIGIILGMWLFYHPNPRQVVRGLKRNWIGSWTGGRKGCLLKLISEE